MSVRIRVLLAEPAQCAVISVHIAIPTMTESAITAAMWLVHTKLGNTTVWDNTNVLSAEPQSIVTTIVVFANAEKFTMSMFGNTTAQDSTSVLTVTH